MADLFDSKSPEEVLKEEICVVYVLYFDEAKGHMPLLIFPFEEGDDIYRYLSDDQIRRIENILEDTKNFRC